MLQSIGSQRIRQDLMTEQQLQVVKWQSIIVASLFCTQEAKE